MKTFIVTALERICGVLHRVPVVRQFHTCAVFADLSWKLDERWGTGVWKPVDPEETQ